MKLEIRYKKLIKLITENVEDFFSREVDSRENVTFNKESCIVFSDPSGSNSYSMVSDIPLEEGYELEITITVRKND